MQTIPSLVLILILVGAGCGSSDAASEPEEWVWDLPEGVLPPRVPENNPMSKAKVELGRFLFYDRRLSANETQSCADCHQQSLAFSDGLDRAVGSTDEVHPRNSMMLANVGYAASLTWANNVLELLEEQALVPMFGETPVELGLPNKELLLERLRNDERYPELFSEAFPGEADPIVLGNVTKAMAAFQRQLTSFDSPYDRWTYERDRTALSESAQRGMALFFGEKLECFHCHGGFLLSQASDHAQNTFDQKSFMNNGLYNLDEDGSYPMGNQGLYDMTFDSADKGRFKPPSLRNIEVTAPYMHDGSIATLEEVLDHYARGGRLIPEGTLDEEGQDISGDGRDNPNKSAFIKGFELTDQEREDVLAFLRSLTDEQFLTNPAFSNPFAEE